MIYKLTLGALGFGLVCWALGLILGALDAFGKWRFYKP
jgi:hypothetical protein